MRGLVRTAAALAAAVLVTLVAAAGGSARTACMEPMPRLSLFMIQPIDDCPTYNWDVSPSYTGDYYADDTAAAAAEPPPPAPVTPALPTWRNLYDWPNGHGYVGWHSASSGAPYGLQGGLGAQPGLWIWPTGGQQAYTQTAWAEWTYTAPGTTRLSSASLSFSYRNKLLAHHCIDIGFRDAAGTVITHVEHCKPVQPPDSQRQVDMSLVDPLANPTSKVLYFRIRVDCGGATTCAKTIPQLDPLTNGPMVRMLRADMTLVDDDNPDVTLSGPLTDVDYVNGSSMYGVTISAVDAGAGISTVSLESPDVGQIVSSPAPCDPTHNTPALDARICPESYTVTTAVDTHVLPEGRIDLYGQAVDPAGNVGTSATASIYVDRTAPAVGSDFSVDNYDSSSSTASISWDGAPDPDLADGSPGAGTDTFAYRYQVNGGGWSDWTSGDEPQFDVANVQANDMVDVETTATDGVGNVSGAGSASLTVTGGEHALVVPTVASDPAPPDYVGTLPDDTDDPSVDVPDDDFGTVSVVRRRLSRAGTATALSANQWCSSATVPGVAWKPCAVASSTDGIKFRTSGTPGALDFWGVFTRCLDDGLVSDLQRKNVGPGYVSYLAHGSHVLINDYHVRQQIDYPGTGLTPDEYDPGFMSFVNGGLAEFGMHWAYGVPERTPAKEDPPDWTGTPKSADYQSVWQQNANDARVPRAVEGRMCSDAVAHPNRSGVYSSTGWKRPLAGITRSGERFLEYGVTVKVRVWDRYGKHYIPTAAPDGQELYELTYLYHVEKRGVKVWLKLTTFPAPAGSGGRVPLVKEPKYDMALRRTNDGGITDWSYTRISAWIDGGGTAKNFDTAVMKGKPQAKGLNTGHTNAIARDWIRWDHGTWAPNPNKPKEPRQPQITTACSDASNPCFNVIIRAARYVSPAGGSHRWSPPATVLWESRDKPAGLDRWAVLADGRAKAFKHDTLGDYLLSKTGEHRTSTCGAPGDTAPANLTTAQVSKRSEGASPKLDEVRYWEISGFKSGTVEQTQSYTNPVPYDATSAAIHGWRGEAGPYDCEPLSREWPGTKQVFVNYASYFFGNDFTPDGFAPLR